jgi:hypothetical protein
LFYARSSRKSKGIKETPVAVRTAGRPQAPGGPVRALINYLFIFAATVLYGGQV